MKLTALILSICLSVICLASCGEIKHDDVSLNIVTTIFPQYDIVRQITKDFDGVSLKMLLPPGSESHDFEPSVSDLSAVAEADLIIAVGGDTDKWIDKVIETSESNASVLRLCDMVPLYEENDDSILEAGHSHHHDHSEHGDGHHTHSEYDEHVWTSPANAADITEVIRDELIRIAPEGTDTFKSNAKDYINNILSIESDMQSAVADARIRTLVFADRFPFRYLAESLNLDCHAAFSGCSSDSEPALSTIYSLTETVKEKGVSVILTVEFSSGDAARVIAEETGARVMTLHSCHNVSREDFNAGVTYVDLMRCNLEVLKEALK